MAEARAVIKGALMAPVDFAFVQSVAKKLHTVEGKNALQLSVPNVVIP